MTLIEKFIRFVEENKLFSKKHKLLLAVSGGIDSVVLWELIKQLGYNYAVAHCNFQLRDFESLEDEEFVLKKANLENVVCYIKRFDTLKYASEQKLSIQEAARNLRYAYFYELSKDNDYDYILTAHNLDDKIETFFINLMRGTGLKGLCSIQVKKDKIVRPLLFCSRNEIADFAYNRKLTWREDSSNNEDKYVRNKIRHYVIPELLKIRPEMYHVFQDNFDKLELELSVIENFIANSFSKCISVEQNKIFINKNQVLSNKEFHSAFILYLKQHDFNLKIAKLLIENTFQTGKFFRNKNYTLINDRENWVIVKNSCLKKNNDKEIMIYENTNYVVDDITLNISTFPINQLRKIPTSPEIACIDMQKLQFPLIMRKWKNGDSIIPLGMKGRKKVSDVLTDCKIASYKRKDTFVLTSGNEIVWIIGVRLSELYKITKDTQQVFCVELINDVHVDDHHDHDYKPF